MTKAEIKKIEELAGVSFKTDSLIVKAFTHRSYLNETNEDEIESNERLEFLGDAILQFLTSEHIYEKYQDFPEGQLTNLRSKLVNTDSLAEESSRIGYAQFLRVSKGEKETAQESNYILADLFESLLGAIYLDKGLEACRKYLDKNLFYKSDEIVDSGQLKDPKSLFQEHAQEEFSITPVYKLISEEGPDHDKTFTVGAYLENKLIAEGIGPSKRKAEQEAARVALEKSKSLD